MNLLERVLTLLGANLNSMIEKADDPEQVLRQLQLDMRNQLVQVKTQVATAIAESHKLRQRSKEREAEAETWLKKAEQAIQQNNDAAARTALGRYNDILKQAKRFEQLQKEQEQLVITMRGALRQLEAKISEVETTIELLVTRKRNALLQQRVYDSLQKTGGVKEKERASRAQDAVIEAEARARALADLHGRDLTSQLDQISEDQFIERQMRDLKAKQKPPRNVPLLHEGKTHPSPLLPPNPQADAPVKKVAESAKGKGEENNSGNSTTPAQEPDLTELKKLFD
ncbi:MAG TPA: PspA/IM30 family protein [Ktedonobacteraceae bacterium]|nr:PspA/IM30 family protein [Ktedonobacteraceae bacterium]